MNASLELWVDNNSNRMAFQRQSEYHVIKFSLLPQIPQNLIPRITNHFRQITGHSLVTHSIADAELFVAFSAHELPSISDEAN